MPLFIYHPRYELKWGGHVFPVEKYRLLHDRLIAEGLVRPDEFLAPEPATDDQLGDLGLTKAGLLRRDELVLGAARERGLPVALVLAGGYARRTDDVVDIHLATCRVMRGLWP